MSLPHADDPVKMKEHMYVLGLVADEHTTNTAVQSGDWDDPLTWGGEVPPSSARVVIPSSVTVTVSSVVAPKYQTIRVDGSLVFSPEHNTALYVDTLVVAPGGVLVMGTDASPVKMNVTARLVIADTGPIDLGRDPLKMGRGLISHGGVRMYGYRRSRWTTFMKPPQSGDEWLWINGSMQGWAVGDTVLIPGLSAEANEDDERRILAISGNSILVQPLSFSHDVPEEWCRAYIANITCNVIVTSESTDLLRRGHIMFMHSQDVYLDNALFYGLGRTNKEIPLTDPKLGSDGLIVPGTDANPRGRYAVHLHRTGVDADHPPAFIVGCVVHDSPGWGFVNHSSSATIDGCVSYNATGAGFVSEVGNEIGFMTNNLSVRSKGSGLVTDKRQLSTLGQPSPILPKNDDFGHGGNGFLLMGSGVVVAGNVAVGHRSAGYVFWLRSLVEGDDRLLFKNGFTSVPNFSADNVIDQPELIPDSRGMVHGERVRLRGFRNNVACACGQGLDFSRHQFEQSYTKRSYSVIEGFYAWNIGDFYDNAGKIYPTIGAEDAQGGRQAICIRYCSHVIIKKSRLLGTPNNRAGVGVNRNQSAVDIVVEDCDIRGWDIGVRSGQSGICRVDRTELDNNIDVEISTPIGSSFPPYAVHLKDNIFLGDAASHRMVVLSFEISVPRLVFKSTLFTLNNRRLYFRQQGPDSIPFPHPGPSWVDPKYIGLTAREINNRYGEAVGGMLAQTAIQVPEINGLIEA